MDARGGTLLALLVLSVSLAGCVQSEDDVDGAEGPDGSDDKLELKTLGDHESTLYGQVVSASLKPLKDASVVVVDLEMNVSTNEQGKYAFEAVAPGTYDAFAQAPGFKVHRFSVKLIGGEAIEQNIILEPAPTERPHTQVLEQVGFLECQTPMVAVTMNCVPIQNVLNDLETNPTNTKQILKWEFETEGLEAIVLEQVWTPSISQTAQDLGLWFETDSADVIEGETYGFANGFSPVRIDVTEENLTEIHNSTATTFQTRTFPVGGLLNTPQPDRFVFMQRFTIFVSLFYYSLPEPGYTGIPDGFDPNG